MFDKHICKKKITGMVDDFLSTVVCHYDTYTGVVSKDLQVCENNKSYEICEK